MRNVNVQIQDRNGNWLTIQTLSTPNDVEIRKRLTETSRMHPDKRVRAIEQSSGSVVDIL